jgi:hypothetical protein
MRQKKGPTNDPQTGQPPVSMASPDEVKHSLRTLGVEDEEVERALGSGAGGKIGGWLKILLPVLLKILTDAVAGGGTPGTGGTSPGGGPQPGQDQAEEDQEQAPQGQHQAKDDQGNS